MMKDLYWHALGFTYTCYRSASDTTSLYCNAGETRFGTNFSLMDCLLQVKDSLERLFADEAWKTWAAQPKYAHQAAAAKKLVHDLRFWKAAEDLHAISE
jgi:hypothetical protein